MEEGRYTRHCLAPGWAVLLPPFPVNQHRFLLRREIGNRMLRVCVEYNVSVVTALDPYSNKFLSPECVDEVQSMMLPISSAARYRYLCKVPSVALAN